MNETAILIVLQTTILNEYGDANVELDSTNGVFSASIEFPDLQKSCVATIKGGRLQVAGKGLFSLPHKEDLSEQLNVLRRWRKRP